MTQYVPRILIAAPRSGGGKTTVVCGLLRALIRRGQQPAAFKCGPDYIDPLFHSEVLGARSGNLDLFFTDENTARVLLAQGSRGCGICVLEGVMGYYDGLGGTTDRASAYHLAAATATPAVLVADAKGASLSVCAEINGFRSFREDSGIRAVILNRCTDMQYTLLKPAIEANCGVEVLGFLPQNDTILLESRHLGLVTAQEVGGLREKLDRIADLLEEHVDLDRLIELAQSAPNLEFSPLNVRPVTNLRPVIAVAKDRAFCFYYRENLELLEKLGARIAYFSPLTDHALPDGASALYLGGGYPELYGRQLSENKEMLDAVKAAIDHGMPAFCECGGFLYLHTTLTDPDGKAWPMADVIRGGACYTGRLRRFGYVTLTAQRDNLLCQAGEQIRSHEFHYYESDSCGSGFTAKKATRAAEWPCIHAQGNLFAGFPHLYFYSNIAFARHFVEAAAKYQEDL